MSDLLHDDDLKTERDTAREPAKVWLNWWQRVASRDEACDECGAPARRFGEVYPNCCGPYPSKDAAETMARDQLSDDIEDYGAPQDLYLGAYPEGERP